MRATTTDTQASAMTPREVVELIARSTRWPDRVEPWSLAELRLDEVQRARLIEWCRSLTESRVASVAAGLDAPLEIEGERVSGQAVFGIALLLAFAEIARREANEGRLWSHVRRTISGTSGHRHALFDAGGQPTASTKHLLERAARRFGVRHAFDLIDHDGYGHNWYTTVFLQFGITRRGFEQNAPYWLRNQNLSRTIRLLLDREGAATGSGRTLYSADFEQLWMNLLLGARKNLEGSGLRAALAGSYWLPREDCDEIAEFLETLDWAAIGDEHAEESLYNADSFVDPFIGSSRWTLFDQGPGVVIELGGLASLELEAPYYDIVVDGRRAARLLRSGETLRLLPMPKHEIHGAPLAFRLPDPLRPVVRALLLDPSGATRAAQELRLWADDEAVSMRQLSEDVAGRGSSSQALLIAEASLTVEPDDIELFPLDDSRFFGVVYRPGMGKPLSFKLGDETVWAMSDDRTPDPARHRAALSASLVSVADSDRGTKRVFIALAATGNIEITAVWHGGSKLEVSRRSSTTVAVEVDVSAARHEVDLLVVARSSTAGLTAKRLRVDIPLSGFFRLRNGRMERCPPTRPITRASVAEGRYVFLPEPRGDSDVSSRTEWTLYEGPHPLGRMPVRGQPRLAPVGLGWPLSARYRPVNSDSETQLCASVVDFGDLRANHDLNPPEDGIISLGLQDSLVDQLDEYSLVIWDCDGRVVSGALLEVADSTRGYTNVRGLPSIDVEYPIAIGLSYRGFRAGAVWRKSWHRHVRDLAAAGVERAAGVVRWLHLPVATPQASTALRQELLNVAPLALIRGLSSRVTIETDDGEISLMLGDAGIQQPGALDTPWFYMLREIVGDWLPPQESVEAFVDACVDGVPHNALKPTPLIASLSTLIRISPRLAVGTAIRYADACGDGSLRTRVLTELALHIAESGTDRELAASEELLHEQAADTLGTILRQTIDPVFVRSLVDRATGPGGWMASAWNSGAAPAVPSYCDSQLLCQFPDGRRLLTIRGALLAGTSLK